MPSDSPISFRPDAKQRQLITEIGTTEGVSASAVIKRGLDLMASTKASALMPLHAKCVGDPDVEAAVEEAAHLACQALDRVVLPFGLPETKGIGSNFQGLLADHLRAMLTGAEHANKSHSTKLNPLFVRWDTFGPHVYPKTSQQGVTLMRPAARCGQAHTFFNDGRFVELAKIAVGGLFTSAEAAVKEYVAWLSAREESPQAYPARLAVIEFTGDSNVVLDARGSGQ